MHIGNTLQFQPVQLGVVLPNNPLTQAFSWTWTSILGAGLGALVATKHRGVGAAVGGLLGLAVNAAVRSAAHDMH